MCNGFDVMACAAQLFHDLVCADVKDFCERALASAAAAALVDTAAVRLFATLRAVEDEWAALLLAGSTESWKTAALPRR